MATPCHDPTAVGVHMPLHFTSHMQTVWQNAFHKQLRERHRQRFNPKDRSISAEEAAWEAMVRHFGQPIHCIECGTVQDLTA